MKINHIVMLRFTEGFLTDEYFSYTTKLFNELKDSVPEILSVKAYQNCIFREGNYHLMIELLLANEASLVTYLKHPLHISFAESHKNDLISRASFDYAAE